MRRAVLAAMSLLLLSLSSESLALTECNEVTDDVLSEVVPIQMRKQVLLQLSVHPSFNSESGLMVSRVGKRSYLTSVQFTDAPYVAREVSPGRFENVRNTGRSARVRVTPLAEATVDVVMRLFRRELAAPLPTPSDSFGFDGVSYRITAGGSCRQTWSPDEETRDGYLLLTLEEFESLSRLPSPTLRSLQEARLAKAWKQRWRL